MHAAQWIGLTAGLCLVAFIAFAFRQGMKVKPDPNNRNFGPSMNDGQAGGDGH